MKILAVDYRIDRDGDLIRSINHGMQYHVLIAGSWAELPNDRDGHDDWLRSRPISPEQAEKVIAEQSDDPNAIVRGSSDAEDPIGGAAAGKL